MPSKPTPPPIRRSTEYLEYLAQSHPGKFDKDIVECCDWAAKRIKQAEETLAIVVNAIKAADQDLSPCRLCGCVVLTVPEGLTLCPTCAKKESGQQ